MMRTAKALLVLLAVTQLLSAQGFELPGLSPIHKAVGSVIGTVKNGTSKGIETVKETKTAQAIDSKVEAVKDSKPAQTIGAGLETVKNVSQKIIPSPSAVLNDIIVAVPDPVELAKNVSDLVKTTNIFMRNNETLNCFGLPIKLFDKTLEKIFMQTTKAEDVRFYFFSRQSPVQKTFHATENFTLEQVDFDVSRPTVVVVHGFMSSGKESWTHDMKNAFLKLHDANTIIVDWQEGSNTWNYYSAAISTRIVGLQIAKLFAKIREQAVAENTAPIPEWSTIYFVGHSLGSHISAYASYLIKESQKDQEESWIVGRITGLDPAQPCFSIADQSLKLDKDDAPFVDVIHTNARHLLFLGLGLPEQLGYVDFYPNGGKAQPGCSSIDTSFWSILFLPATLIKESVCSHGRSHQFLTESVTNLAAKNCSFYGYPWDRKSENEGKALKDTCSREACTEMGVTSSNHYPDNAGVYFVPTGAEAPYCAVNDDTTQLLKSTQYESNIFARIPKSYQQTS